MKKIVVCCFLICCVVCPGWAQERSLEVLRGDYPLLTGRFEKELEDQRADYVFAIDVSGTMERYKDIVVPALQEFFRSLEMDDYVSVIKFGGEATNELSSYGTVSPALVESLIAYVPNLYRKPTNAEEKKRFFNYTDLDAMLAYLADDLKSIGRNNLKFVFIITDFVHDPPKAKLGKEQWAVTARRLKNEQHGNHLYAFALQLPGNESGRDLRQVREVLEGVMDFELQEIQSGQALSEWFARKKNEIMLDKLTALVERKNKNIELALTAEVSREGKLALDVQWVPNELYETLSLDTLMPGDGNFYFNSYLPQAFGAKQVKFNVGQMRYHNLLAWPLFHPYRDSIAIGYSTPAPYRDELLRLGIEPAVYRKTIPLSGYFFSFVIPLWLTVLLVVLLLIYLLLVMAAWRRNRSGQNKINGSFVVRKDGEDIAGWKKCQAATTVDIGRGASFLPVTDDPDCNWLLEIRYVTYSPFRLKNPAFRCRLLKGARFKVNGKEYLNHQHPLMAKGSKIRIDEFYVAWKL